MTATAVETYDEAERLLIYRLKGFQALGVADYVQALELAMSPVALHDAEVMVERGCAPELLASILT